MRLTPLPGLVAALLAATGCSINVPGECPDPTPPGCARCAEVAALVRPAAELCRSLDGTPGADSATLWEAFEECLCSGPCSAACAASCSPPHAIAPSDVTGACGACAQVAGHGPDDQTGCGRSLELCSLDAPP